MKRLGKTVPLLLVTGALTALGLRSGPGPEGEGADAFVAWATKHAVPIKTIDPGRGYEDLAALKDIIGNARLVCLGESRHDAHEHFQLKRRLVEFLVEQMGFALFAMEESLPCVGPLNDYIQGGAGDPEELLSGIGAWFIWDTEEVLALVRWMREYNEDPAHPRKVRFYGIDVTSPWAGLESVHSYLAKVDPEYAEAWGAQKTALQVFRTNVWVETLDNYRRLPAEDVDVLGETLDELMARFRDKRPAYVANSSSSAYMWAARQALVAKRAHDLYVTGVRGTFQEAGDVRERAMADNVRWLLNEVGNGERVIVWAHNFHVGRDTFDLDIPGRPPTDDMVSMAHYLGGDLGPDLVTIGFSFNRGDDPDSPLPPAAEGTVDAALAQVGHPVFLVDLRSAPKAGPVYAWLNRKQRMRGEGGVAELVPARSYDVLAFTERITRTVPTARARARLRALGQR
jgi:erythromycin esterase